jgi:hypothetical protein
VFLLPEEMKPGMSVPNLLKAAVKPDSILLKIFARGCNLVCVGS